MLWIRLTFILPLILCLLGATQSLAQSRCVADLGRVQTDFCLTDSHAAGGADPLNYSWKTNSDAFDLKFNVCFADGTTTGSHLDMTLAIDKSFSATDLDRARLKSGPDEIEMAQFAFDSLVEQYKTNPDQAPKIGVILFSNDNNCRAYTGGAITFAKNFPCLFIKANSVANTNHQNLVRSLFTAAKDQYSDSGAVTNADYRIVATALEKDQLGLKSAEKYGLVFIGDGRPYSGKAEQIYPYLHTSSFNRARSLATGALTSAKIGNAEAGFAIINRDSPYFGDFFTDAMETMCDLDEAENADCNGTDFNSPASWPVNKVQQTAFPSAVLKGLGNRSELMKVTRSKDEIAGIISLMKKDVAQPTTPKVVEYSINGGGFFSLQPASGVTLPNLPAGETVVDIKIETNNGVFEIPMSLTVDNSTPAFEPVTDGEMVCSAEGEPPPQPFQGPKSEDPNLVKIQGGSASCGVAGAGKTSKAVWFLVLLPLVVASSRLRRRGAFMMAIAAITVLPQETALAGTAKGINAVQFKPTASGLGLSEKAESIRPLRFNVGLITDYSNDSVELGGEKNKRLESVVDDVVTLHGVFELGLMKNLQAGLHIPYVHKTDVAREVSGDEFTSQNVGVASDATLDFKYRFYTYKNMIFAVQPFATIPIGEEKRLTGDGKANFGLNWLMSGRYSRIEFAYNLGYLHRQDKVLLQDDRSEVVTIRGHVINRAGMAYVFRPYLKAGGSLQMKFSSGAPVDFGRANPAEWNSFVRYEPLRALSTEVGFGTGIGKGYGSPDYRAYFGLAYTPGSSERITRTRVVRKASKPAKAKAATKKPRRKVVVTSSSSARKPPARR